MNVLTTTIETPVGVLLVARNEAGIAEIHFERNGRPARPDPAWTRDDGAFVDLRDQLDLYFGGQLRRFDLPLAPAGTPFQMRVWEALRAIPYGQTRTYGQIAQSIGRPSACRAVGAANGANPLPIVVPCHRVVGSDGSLTGFGGGIEVKARLLRFESEGATPGEVPGSQPPAGQRSFW
jgi:methylated-DNA-[protein]-cysteine S-methyltransferase